MEMRSIKSILKSWGLSESAISILSKEPEIVSDLESTRTLPPFAEDYEPELVEVLFDDVVHIRREYGKVVYELKCPVDYQPPFVEYVFDGSTGLFMVGAEIVVNRMSQMAELFVKKES